jgi:hypothetical protein
MNSLASPQLQKTLLFTTKGAIDPLSWTVMGLNVKDNESAIGFFGTGLKYAIAVGVREGWSITVRSFTPEGDPVLYRFGRQDTSFRGKSFELIECNGVPLPYTTELGKNWKPWMALRELICNTWDEEGEVRLAEQEEFLLMPGTSQIAIEGESAIEAFGKFDEHFCKNHHVLAVVNGIEILRPRSDGRKIYYKGVEVMETLASAMFNYNILSKVDLTEDRTLRYPSYEVDVVMSQIFKGLEDKDLARKFLTMSEQIWEQGCLNPPAFRSWSAAVQEVAMEVFGNSPTLLSGKLQRRIIEAHPEKGFSTRSFDDLETGMLDRAKGWLNQAGHHVTAEIRMATNDDTDNIAFVKQKVIYLTERAFGKGIHYLVSTLIEEQAHVDGHYDCSREYEQHLIDLLITQAAKRIGAP